MVRAATVVLTNLLHFVLGFTYFNEVVGFGTEWMAIHGLTAEQIEADFRWQPFVVRFNLFFS